VLYPNSYPFRCYGRLPDRMCPRDPAQGSSRAVPYLRSRGAALEPRHHYIKFKVILFAYNYI